MNDLDPASVADALRALEARVRDLEDALAISQLIATYGPAVDSGDAEAAGDLWCDDGTYDLNGDRLVDGAEAIAAMVRSEHHQALIGDGAAHVLAAPLIVVHGDRAVATCYSNVFRPSDDGYVVWRTAANRWELERTADGWRTKIRVNRLLDGSEAGRELLRRGVGELAQLRNDTHSLAETTARPTEGRRDG